MDTFAAADEALEQAISSPEHSEDTQEKAQHDVSEAPNQQDELSKPEIVDLDKLERFVLDGREWTAKDLRSAYMMQADYTRKTQEIAEERKYYENLRYDLDAVKNDPSLVEQFKKVYPEKFHSYLDVVAAQNQAHQQAQAHSQGQMPALDPAIRKEIDAIKKFREEFEQQQVEATEAKLSALYDKLGSKYEMANEQTVTATAQAMLQQGVKLDDQTWEKIFKADHDRNMQRYQSYYEKQVKTQKDANAKARDMGKGGAAVGTAPKRLSFDEATAAAIRDLEATGA